MNVCVCIYVSMNVCVCVSMYVHRHVNVVIPLVSAQVKESLGSLGSGSYLVRVKVRLTQDTLSIRGVIRSIQALS